VRPNDVSKLLGKQQPNYYKCVKHLVCKVWLAHGVRPDDSLSMAAKSYMLPMQGMLPAWQQAIKQQPCMQPGASASSLLADVFAIVRRRACHCALHKNADRTVQLRFAVESRVLARQGTFCKRV